MRILFMGTSSFAAEILRTLVEDRRFEIVGVYAKPHNKPGAVVRLAKGLEIKALRTPTRFDSSEERFINDLAPDVGVAVDYGVKLPREILQLPKHGFINAHPSLLPRWRGAAPIERAILAGDEQTGICIMKMNEALDEGAVFSCESIDIKADENAGELRQRLAPLAADAVVRVLGELHGGRAQAVPQSGEGVCYAEKIKKSEGCIDWRLPGEELHRRIRAFTPEPGAWFEASLREKPVRVGILRARVVERGGNAPSGTILDDSLCVACGSGALQLLELQREGRKPMEADAFLRGFPLPPGTRLPPPKTSSN
ncbi:MAG: methionyl-tRNA formyltransferase [Hyphomicrobiales bacterium]|nr:methionyl-tRNA formyltransferase [Hyphomicrobiales bacterium]